MHRINICLCLLLIACNDGIPTLVVDGSPAQRDLSLPDQDVQIDNGATDISFDGPYPEIMSCAAPPCATRPIIFVHGHRGSHAQWSPLLTALIEDDPRFDEQLRSAVEDHASWASLSVDRRGWLFAFDYYRAHADDPEGSYSAGPGRIGSNTAHACTSPVGKGYLISLNPLYDQGVAHDYAADLATFVDSVLRATGADEVDLVGHSMGGMVIRSYLSFFRGDTKVKRVLLLASPVYGALYTSMAILYPTGQPEWMNVHEIAELDAGPASTTLFMLCDSVYPVGGSWSIKLVEQELKQPPQVEFHVMSGQGDTMVTYLMASHPLAVTHETVPQADHFDMLRDRDVQQRVMELLGGSTPP